jgi:hypothetical protein
MAERVFISYRRSDSRDVAARLSDRLAVAAAVKSVFLDVANIAPGEAFPDRLERALAECDVVLALIGQDWASPLPDGGTRIARDGDFVRMEIARALVLGKKLIPVLLDNADIPVADSLPDDVRDITVRNALFLRHASFNQDYQIVLDAVAGRKARGPLRRMVDTLPWLTPVMKTIAGVFLGLMALLVMALINNGATDGQPLETTLGSRAMLILLGMITIGGGVAASFRLSGRLFK